MALGRVNLPLRANSLAFPADLGPNEKGRLFTCPFVLDSPDELGDKVNHEADLETDQACVGQLEKLACVHLLNLPF